MDDPYDPTERFDFEVTGGFSIRDDLKPELSPIGNIMRFKLPDGRFASLVVALEIMPEDESSTSYITSELEMDKLGFEGLDYKELRFVEK